MNEKSALYKLLATQKCINKIFTKNLVSYSPIIVNQHEQ